MIRAVLAVVVSTCKPPRLCSRQSRMRGGKAERVVPPVDFHLHLEHAAECADDSAQRPDPHMSPQ